MTTTSSTSGSTSTATIWEAYQKKQSTAVASSTSGTGSSSSSSATQAKIQEMTGNFETFIKILTTQLQNQDPTNAADVSKFTEELVQFAGVEQQLATNSKLDTLISTVGSDTTASLMNYVGKYVQSSTTSNKVVVQDGTAAFAYTLSDTPTSVAITVKDSNGNVLATMSGPTASGSHSVTWDGKKSDGTQVADGTYTLSVKETKADGTTAAVTDVYLVGMVTSVNIDSTKGNTFSIGDQTIDTSKISNVYSAIKSTSATTS